jgi:hypothetical protein
VSFVAVTRIIAGAGLLICLAGILLRLRSIMSRPYRRDLSRAQGSRWQGILYAFTLGMAPWEKESGRKHWAAYFRGVLFHIGAFGGLALLPISPWLDRFPAWLIWLAALGIGVGALSGFAGVAMRRLDRNAASLSVPDDYFSVALVSVFEALAALALLVPAALPMFYLVAAALLIYLPFSKIRHCVYFFYAKFFFGANFGHRGVLGQPESRFSR